MSNTALRIELGSRQEGGEGGSSDCRAGGRRETCQAEEGEEEEEKEVKAGPGEENCLEESGCYPAAAS